MNYLRTLIILLLTATVADAQIVIDGRPLAHDRLTATWLANIDSAALTGTRALAVTTGSDIRDLVIDGTPVTAGTYAFADLAAGKAYPFTAATDTGAIAGNIVFTPLPILQLFGDFGYDYAVGTVRLISTGEDTTALTAKLKWRGGHSNQPGRNKRNYHIKFIDANGNKVNRSLLGMRDDNSWLLDAGQVDLCRVRNRVATDLWNDFATPPYYSDSQPNARTGVRGTAIEVLLNDEYRGIYCLTEAMDRKQLKLKKFDNADSVLHGILWKTKAWSDAVTMGAAPEYDNTQESWENFYVKYPDIDEVNPTDFSALWQAVNLVANADDSTFRASVAARFDLPVLIDYYLLCDVLLARDNWGKNIYWVCYDTQRSPMLTPAVWDLDATCGQNFSDDGIRFRQDLFVNPQSDIDQYPSGDFVLFNRLISLNVDDFGNRLRARYHALREGAFSTDSLKARYVNAINRLISSGAAAREEQRWSGDTGDLGGHTLDLADERDYICDWFDTHLAWLDRKYTATGDVNADGEINIADVNALISIILGNSVAEDYAGQADVNADSEINIADVNAVIAIILGN